MLNFSHNPNANAAPPRTLKPIKNKKEEKQNINEQKPKIIRKPPKAKSNILQSIKNKKGANINTVKNAIKAKSCKNVNGTKFRKAGPKNTRILLTNTKIKSASKDNLLLSNNTKINNKFGLKTANDKIKKSEAFENLNTSNQKNDQFFNEYLATNVDDMEFDDAIVKDNRKICEFLYQTIKEKQAIANTFCAVDVLKTRTMKLIIFILDIILYLIVNGIFFSENYVSEVYNIEGEEGFFDFFPRSINRFVYTTVVSLIVGFIVGCFFFDEKKIKGIFIREKDDRITLKGEIVALLREMQRRYLIFVIIVFIILILALYYLLCFNYVYPYMQIEWIKSSIVIMIILQIISLLTCIFETIFRFLSFRYKSERIYKLSKIIN